MYAKKKLGIRKRGGDLILSRMYNVRPNAGERFFLRLLLLHVKGATSFEYLRTVNGVVFDTFREACSALGILADDNEWDRTLSGAEAYQMPRQLRRLFGILLTCCKPSDPLVLWNDHKHSMMEDYKRSMSDEHAEQLTLFVIEKVLKQNGQSLAHYNLPPITDLEDEDDCMINDMRTQADFMRPYLTNIQADISNEIISAVENISNGVQQDTRLFFIDGPAGTGKSFIFNYITSELGRKGYNVKSAAFSGIAATLLFFGGSTLHRLFGLPVPLLQNSVCRISPTSGKAEILRNVDVFILDEASMISTHALHAINNMLKDICKSSLLFGGKAVVFGGDFRQVLPVLRHAQPAQIVEICLKSSPLWNNVKTCSLTQNMRAKPEEQEFCEWLLQVGDGEACTKPDNPFKGCIQIPECCALNSDSSIVNEMFDGLDEDEFVERVILTPTNEDSLLMNKKVLELWPGDSKIFASSDSIETDDGEDVDAYPLEFINGLTPSGMPPHLLELKIGAIVMLLRNIDLKEGLCNGTRLRVTEMNDILLTCEILTGSGSGTFVFIPRMDLDPSDTGMPFKLIRRQFPVRLSYAMTINKAQGQTFSKVGLYLKRPCFSHGQLYVAFSRAKAFSDVMVKIEQTTFQGLEKGSWYTKNVVFKEVLH